MGRARKLLVGIGTGVAVALAMLTRRHMPEEHARRGSVAAIGWAFLLSFGASVSLTVIYALGGQPQAEGAMLFVALGGLSVGLVLWSHLLMPQGIYVEERKLTFDEPEEMEEADRSWEVMRRVHGNRWLAAQWLGLNRATVRKKLGQYHLPHAQGETADEGEEG